MVYRAGKVTKVMKKADHTFELYYADEGCKAVNTIDPDLHNSLGNEESPAGSWCALKRAT